jgi:cell division protein FtsZ
MMEGMVASAPYPIPHAAASAPVTAQYPRSAPAASRSELFAPQAAPAMSEAPRPSLFSQVTGVLRRRLPATTPQTGAQPVRSEPALHESRPETPRASVRQTAGDEVGLDIPAFLRRQSS